MAMTFDFNVKNMDLWGDGNIHILYPENAKGQSLIIKQEYHGKTRVVLKEKGKEILKGYIKQETTFELHAEVQKLDYEDDIAIIKFNIDGSEYIVEGTNLNGYLNFNLENSNSVYRVVFQYAVGGGLILDAIFYNSTIDVILDDGSLKTFIIRKRINRGIEF
jgi:hypothetical protein